MNNSTLAKKFNEQELDVKYKNIWNRGIHLFTVVDRNRDFQYCIFFVDLLFVEVVYNNINGDILMIKSFTDKAKLMFYMREDFS
ncbi:hypothetical protein [Aquimarina pacifica]|uniref:hypothetical protein n=1 Tax=Aquimarina pacifica TaxID=1296415 RepID=UPI00047103ED|nr:hypothetical protein [Aquimarina pacifica]